MFQRAVSCVLVGLVFLCLPVAAAELSSTLLPTAEQESELLMTPFCEGSGSELAGEGWDPATCGRCGTTCTSDNACMGLLLGDACTNAATGITGACMARTGCALYNCCFCG